MLITCDKITIIKDEKMIKKIEQTMTKGFSISKIKDERNKRNKSSFVWFDNEKHKIKLEIGSSVRPDPYSLKKIKSYIQEYLEENNPEDVEKFDLKAVTLMKQILPSMILLLLAFLFVCFLSFSYYCCCFVINF